MEELTKDEVVVNSEMVIANGYQWHQTNEHGTINWGYHSQQVKLLLMSDGSVRWENYVELSPPPAPPEGIPIKIQGL